MISVCKETKIFKTKADLMKVCSIFSRAVVTVASTGSLISGIYSSPI